METGLSEVSRAHHDLKCDLEGLLCIYNNKEAWYKQESETARKRLSEALYELRKVETTRRLLQEDITAVDANLEGVSRKYSHRENQLDALRQELKSELQWLQEVMGAVLPEGDNGSLDADIKQTLKEMLHQFCGTELCPEAKESG